MNIWGKTENSSTRKSHWLLAPSLGIAALTAVVAFQASIGTPSEAEAGVRRLIRTSDGRVLVVGQGGNLLSSRFNKVSLNPQPLPPKEMLTPLDKVGLNPQPLPPRSSFLIRHPGFGR